MNEAEWQQKWGIELTSSPQVFCKLPREAYDDLPGINASLCKEVIGSTEAHAWKKCIDPNRPEQEERDAFIQGNIAHALVLEWDEVSSRYVLAPDLPKRPTEKQLIEPDRLTKGGKPAKAYETWKEYKAIEDQWIEWEKTNLPPTAEIVSEANYSKGFAYANALWQHPILKYRYEKTEKYRMLNEITFTYIDTQTKRRIKARIDSLRIFDDHLWIGDIKTAQDAGEGESHFGLAIAKYGYIVQSAFYHDALYHCRTALEKIMGFAEGSLIILPIIFEWVAIEKDPIGPEFIGRYYMTDEQLSDGRSLYRLAVNKVHLSLQIDYWPGYSVSPSAAVLPGWYKRTINQQKARLKGEQ